MPVKGFTMMLDHRPATSADVPTLCTFPQTAEELFFMFPKAEYPLTEPQLLAAISQRFECTVVTDDQAVIAFANFYRAERQGVCCIGNVIVALSARGRGVATYLVETMMGIAHQRYEASEVQVSCFNHNTAGLLLYRKLGFEPFEIEARTSSVQNRVALVHMRRSSSYIDMRRRNR